MQLNEHNKIIKKNRLKAHILSFVHQKLINCLHFNHRKEFLINI